MKANHQFSIAMHMMTCLGAARDREVTSSVLAASVNTSPSFIRRTLSKLAKAKLVKTTKGKGGAVELARDPGRISMFDIYEAVDAPPAFSVHQYPNQSYCPVSCKIKPAMQKVIDKAQVSVEETLKKVSLAEVVSNLKK